MAGDNNPKTYVTLGTLQLTAGSGNFTARINPTEHYCVTHNKTKLTALVLKPPPDNNQPPLALDAKLANPDQEFKLTDGLGTLLVVPATQQTLLEFTLDEKAEQIISVTFPAPQ